MSQAKRLGEILVERGIITLKTRDRVLRRAESLNRRLGNVLEDLGLVTGEELAAALANQHGYKTATNLNRLTVPADLLELIPIEVAMQHLVFPLKKEGDRLALAMADPTDMRIANNLAADSGLKIVPFIATKEDIREAISHHYLGKPAARPTSRTILAVDDDRLIRSMLTEILEKDGYRVLTAADGMQAFRTVIAESPHVIITDLVMPKFDGYGLLNALKNIPETSFIPVILISGQLKSEEEELKAFEKGFFDVILKPLNQASVRARVKRAFHFYDNQYRLF
ncbi:MAG TPA: response regulator [Desulfuromonadales bacterium]|jgi:PleD family two-component response regulator